MVEVSSLARPRFEAIDLLRFLAACAVALYHYAALGPATGHTPQAFPALFPAARYGYLGVDLFFIISGFVIALSAEGRTAPQFLLARARRLYPAFWASCTLAALVTLAPTWGAAWRYLANMTLFAPYLGEPSIDGVYWSLYMEVRFYVLVAAVLLLRQLPRLHLVMAAWLMLSAIHMFKPIPLGAGLLVLEFCPLFVAGTIYSAMARGATRPAHLALLPAAVVLSVVYACRRVTPLGGDPAVIAGATLLFHAAVWAIATRRLTLPGWRALPFLGALSYPIYLLHNEVGGAILRALPAAAPAAALGLALAAVTALAAVVHLLIERPAARRPQPKAIGQPSRGSAAT